MKLVGDSWTKKELYAECQCREIAGCADLNKAGHIQRLNHGA